MKTNIVHGPLAAATVAFMALVCPWGAAPGFSQPAGVCAAIKDDTERLKCYDAPPVAKPAAAKEDPAIIKAKAVIRQNLKDPDSARFEGILKRPEAVCGFVNSKNSMGGYAGRKMFVYLIKSNQGWVLEINSDGVQQAMAAAQTHCTGVPGF